MAPNTGTRESSFYDHLYSPNTEWKPLDVSFLQLPHKYSFDLDRARWEFKQIREKYPLKPFPVGSPSGKTRPRLTYRGLGLTMRPNAPHGFYDALNLVGPQDQTLDIYQSFKVVSDRIPAHQREVRALDESSFSEPTDACSPFFQRLLDRFESPKSKVRFLELMPKGIIPPHIDFPYYQGIRIHAALYSEPGVSYQVEEDIFTIPPDGNFYWFDTGKYHSVANRSSANRITLSINLLVYFDRDGGMLHTPQESLIDLIQTGRI